MKNLENSSRRSLMRTKKKMCHRSKWPTLLDLQRMESSIMTQLKIEDRNLKDSTSEFHHQNMMTRDSLLEVVQGTEIYLIFSLTRMRMNQIYSRLSKTFLLRKLEA